MKQKHDRVPVGARIGAEHDPIRKDPLPNSPLPFGSPLLMITRTKRIASSYVRRGATGRGSVDPSLARKMRGGISWIHLFFFLFREKKNLSGKRCRKKRKMMYCEGRYC